MRRLAVALILTALSTQISAKAPAPIIDMHMHALGAADFGPAGLRVCTSLADWSAHDPAKPISTYQKALTSPPACRRYLIGAANDAELRDESLAVIRRRNIYAVTSGNAERVEEWRRKQPDRIIAGLDFGGRGFPTIAELRALHAAGRLDVMGEITAQHAGIPPDSPQLEPYYALAEELDIPVGIHIGTGVFGGIYSSTPHFRIAMSNAMLLEDVLARHPRLRLYVMHAGWPLADDMIALMFAHPQVYLDTAAIDYMMPRAGFHAYLKRLVEAGFGKRVMFGSDQLLWPAAIEAAIEGIDSAPFLSAEQKRDILYNNAARFLRLTPEQMARQRASNSNP